MQNVFDVPGVSKHGRQCQCYKGINMPTWRFWSRGQDECCEDSTVNVQINERQIELLKGCFWAIRLFGFLS